MTDKKYPDVELGPLFLDTILHEYADLTEELRENDPDSLLSNVKYLLDKCPYTVRDMSGERTGIRYKEDIAGSLAITFLGMQHRLEKYENRS